MRSEVLGDNLGGFKSEEERQAAKEFNEKNGIDFTKLNEVLQDLDFDSEKFNQTKKLVGEFKSEIDKYNLEDKQRIINALVEMLKLHQDQTDRPDGSPYVNHPLEVASDVMELDAKANPDLVVASLLHDTVEDQGIKLSIDYLEQKYGSAIKNLDQADLEETYGQEIRDIALSEISRKYGKQVGGLIQHLSNPNFDELLKLPEYQDKTKNELYKEHVEEAIRDRNVLVIKYVDFSKNALSLDNLPEGFKKEKLKAKYTPVIRVFIERFKDESLLINNKEDIINKLEQAYGKLTTAS